MKAKIYTATSLDGANSRPAFDAVTESAIADQGVTGVLEREHGEMASAA